MARRSSPARTEAISGFFRTWAARYTFCFMLRLLTERIKNLPTVPKLSSRISLPPLARKLTDAITAWAMTKEIIDEAWIVKSDRNYHSLEDVDLGVVVLLSGWDDRRPSVQERVAREWTEVAVRWSREVANLSDARLGLRTIYAGDWRGLEEVRQTGARLFSAI